METKSIIRHLFCDDDSLSSYYNREIVSLFDIQRRLFLLDRNVNRTIPDHYYRLNQEMSLDGFDTIAKLINNGLYKIAESHLEMRANRIYVKQEKQNDWQQIITQIPPLILQAAYLNEVHPLINKDTKTIRTYFEKYIVPNSKYTSLPYPYIAQIEYYIENNKGFHDLHLHLNGSTETDIAWQDFLHSPDEIYKELKKGYKNNFVREQFEQESHLTDSLKFRDLLIIARRIRNFLYLYIFPNTINNIKEFEFNSFEVLLQKILDINTPFCEGIEHPFSDIINDENIKKNHPMALEGLMYVLVFDYLKNNPKESVASLFHFYLLILGLANRLLVQQTHENGFEQFQKHTVNELRKNCEQKYKSRFLQLHGNELRNINFLEGRFSPKKTNDENISLLFNIYKGWDSLKTILKNEYITNSPQLKLVAHFIKSKDKERDQYTRHKNLRKDVWERAEILANMKDNNTKIIENVIGIDAAASEFDTPPEVFAPAFRLLRNRGFNHFTYHAGEDFYHIISGLRAIYEAIDFTDMRKGDRIGHAVASGIDPKLWINNIGKRILIRKGEYLDNLIFGYFFINKEEIINLKSCIPQLVNKISELSFDIYKTHYSVDVLIESWLLRKYCPMLISSLCNENAKVHNTYIDNEWFEIKKKVADVNTDIRIKILEKYHFYDKNKKNLYEEIIEIEAVEIFDEEAIKELQLALLKYMHKKEIVIETLPTSNVRIGHHKDYHTYHLWNWLKWEEEGFNIPPIVVGTDDAGIFATNIFNEYANIYCHLTCECKMTHEKAMTLVEKLNKNASIYKFN